MAENGFHTVAPSFSAAGSVPVSAGVWAAAAAVSAASAEVSSIKISSRLALAVVSCVMAFFCSANAKNRLRQSASGASVFDFGGGVFRQAGAVFHLRAGA